MTKDTMYLNELNKIPNDIFFGSLLAKPAATADGSMRVGSLVYMCAGDDTPIPDPLYSPEGELIGMITSINPGGDDEYESAVVWARAYPEGNPSFWGRGVADTQHLRTIRTTYLMPVAEAECECLIK